MKKEITFLIGAGAETSPLYDLPSGKYFKANIIKNDNLSEIFNIFNENVSSLVDNHKILKYNASSTLYQTIKENFEDYKVYSSKLNTKDVNVINKYLEYKSDKNKSKAITAEFQKLFNNKVYKKIISGTNLKKDSLANFYLDHLSFCSYVDSYFNFLRNVNLYNKECSRVIKLYYSAFKTIVFGVGNIEEKTKNIQEENILIRRKQFIEILNSEFNNLIDNSKKNDENYYYLINEFKNKYNLIINNDESLKFNRECDSYINIITTNYTCICQKVISQDVDKIAYVHGKLNLFENIYTKEIKDLCEFTENDIIMPYLMIPSGIKPIISPYQINEWHKAVNFIDNSKYVIVLGYGINSDDEHITTILREYSYNRKYIFFLYSKNKIKDEYKNEKTKILNIFGYSKNFYFFSTDEFGKVLNYILVDEKLKSTIE